MQEFDVGHEDGGDRIIAGMYRYPDALNRERRGGERRRRRVYVFRDRRSGFERRDQQRGGVPGLVHNVLVTLRDNPAALRVLLVAVNALNLIDFGFTLNALSLGAGEANPVMASLFEAGPVWAGLFKTVAVLVATAIVWECRRYRKALAAGVLILLVFVAVFVYHIVGLSLYA